MQNLRQTTIYRKSFYGQTHPQHLYTIAKLFQFPAVDFTNARILDLGCGDGSNLINIAYQLPSSTCLASMPRSVQRGIDMCDFCRYQQLSIGTGKYF